MAEYKYRTELEARLDFVVCFARFAGLTEGGAEHRWLIGMYNTIEPQPRGYDITKRDAWCAASLSAVANSLGYQRWPFECSCSKMLEKAKELGLETHERGYRPQPGDLLIYDLDLNGSIDHIGAASWVEGEEVWVWEGNFSDTVKCRKSLRFDDPRIKAWICPDYTELVEPAVCDGRPHIPVEFPDNIIKEDEDMKIYHNVDEMPEFAQKPVSELVEAGIIEGIGDGDLYMNETELRLATWLWRGLRSDRGLPDSDGLL